jgi:hypothetical protein
MAGELGAQHTIAAVDFCFVSFIFRLIGGVVQTDASKNVGNSR